ncbi:MAG: hypothetical protein ACFFCW_12490 [Candidatus Hodarchaeota archaeon]
MKYNTVIVTIHLPKVLVFFAGTMNSSYKKTKLEPEIRSGAVLLLNPKAQVESIHAIECKETI